MLPNEIANKVIDLNQFECDEYKIKFEDTYFISMDHNDGYTLHKMNTFQDLINEWRDNIASKPFKADNIEDAISKAEEVYNACMISLKFNDSGLVVSYDLIEEFVFSRNIDLILADQLII